MEKIKEFFGRSTFENVSLFLKLGMGDNVFYFKEAVLALILFLEEGNNLLLYPGVLIHLF